MSDQNSDQKPKAKKTPPKPGEKTRREFLRSGVLAAGVLGASLLGYYPVLQGSALRLRPPGAIKTPLDEQEFFASCIKCGQCVQVCPVYAIKLADITDGFGIGVPYIDAREQACDFSCDGLQCVLACPTGALTHDLNFPADTRMGLAELTRPDTCLAMQGQGFKGQARGADFKGVLRFSEVDRWNPIPLADHPFDLEICDLCVRLCPIEIRIAECAAEAENDEPQNTARVAQKIGNECPPRSAIKLVPMPSDDGVKRMQPVILDGCVGCGVCEMVCPPQIPSLTMNIKKTVDHPGGA
ncbi:4Fe-4S dicluster domain-containing protein [Magnetovirga frankeli]|uniref:4Fe-4S dicluster domain-containing protein n=1 Tax=Magnetovirga frankeli TaxID=947516 RepID=UPI00129332AD|nr:4Fe-4S dicluster domain-containing protein [gamma proteobacterium SS-5]